MRKLMRNQMKLLAQGHTIWYSGIDLGPGNMNLVTTANQYTTLSILGIFSTVPITILIQAPLETLPHIF